MSNKNFAAKKHPNYPAKNRRAIVAETRVDLRRVARFTVAMKFILSLLIVAMLVGGCISKKKKPSIAPAAAMSQTIVTPDNSFTAKVASYNSAGQFVVLSFSGGQLPKMDQVLFLYRNGLKVGEVKITGPQSDNNIVADLITGDAQAGDEVRAQ